MFRLYGALICFEEKKSTNRRKIDLKIFGPYGTYNWKLRNIFQKVPIICPCSHWMSPKYFAKDMARMYLQLPLRQWGAGNVYLLVLSSWKVNIAENPIAIMGL